MGLTLVTGGAKRLGAEICRTLAREGYDVLIHYRNSRDEAENVAAECKILGVKAEILQGDFSSMEGIQHTLDKINENSYKVENLINNVGNFLSQPLLHTSLADWQDLFQANLHAPFALISGLISNIKSFRGSIINIGTAGAMDSKADSVISAYMITKRALFLMTKSLAKELAKDKVRVNMVSPGILMNSVSMPSRSDTIPLGRTGELEEVCRAILFLLDKNNPYIIGQNIEVAGGYAL